MKIFFSSLSLFLVGIFSLCFVGCSGNAEVDNLKKEIAEKDAQISTLNKQLDFFTSENDTYTTEDGYTITIEGGKVFNVTNECIYIKTIESRPGFSVWKKGDEVVSATNVLEIEKDYIDHDTTYTALYNCIGVMAVSGDLSNNKQVQSIGAFNNSATIKLFYSYTNNNNIQNCNWSVTGTTHLGDYLFNEVDSVKLLCYNATVSAEDVTFFKIFLPEGVDPFKVVESTNENTTDWFDEEGEQIRSFTDDDALIYWMNTQGVNTNTNASVCASMTNQKSGDEFESKKGRVIIKK